MPRSSSRPAAAMIVLSLAALALVGSGCIFSIGHGHDCDETCVDHVSKKSTSDRAHCPVTGESVSKKTAPSATVEGDTYYFHCNTCKSRFLADPNAYLHGKAVEAASHDDSAR